MWTHGFVIASSLLLLACGGNNQPAATPSNAPPQPTVPETAGQMSAEECTAQGGEVRGDIGDGQIACAEGERELGRVPLGIEGSICCAPADAP